MFKRRKRESQQPTVVTTTTRITIYLEDATTEFDGTGDSHVAMEGFRPFYDRELSEPVELDDHACTGDHLIYCRLAGGTHHEDIRRPEFDLGATVLLVVRADQPGRSARPQGHGTRQGAEAGRELLRRRHPAGPGGRFHTPHPGGKIGQAVVVQTVVANGVRTGLRLVGSVGMDMVVTSVVDEDSGAGGACHHVVTTTRPWTTYLDPTRPRDRFSRTPLDQGGPN